MSQLSDKHLPAVIQAAQLARIPLNELKMLNPCTQKGPKAMSLIAALSEIDPAALAEMRAEAGEPMTVETAGVRAGLIEMTPTAHADLMATDGDYVRQQREQAIRREQDQLEAWDRQAKEKARNQVIRQHGGDVAAADRFIRQQEQQEKAKAEQAARDAESTRQLEERIRAKQNETLRQARLAQNVVSGVTQ